jgi:hypothetical protein
MLADSPMQSGGKCLTTLSNRLAEQKAVIILSPCDDWQSWQWKEGR